MKQEGLVSTAKDQCMCSQHDPYLTVLEQTVKNWAVSFAKAAQVESAHLSQIFVLIVRSHATEEVDILCSRIAL